MVTIAIIGCTRTREDVECKLHTSAKKFASTTEDNLTACIGCPHAEITWTTQGISRRKSGLKTVFENMDLGNFKE
ncbi:MAG: hypothetical protein PHT13_00900 [Methanosarcina sp.]|jgi:hypothetical protein|nr:hypothetical protein [Methanosarcina sp.]